VDLVPEAVERYAERHTSAVDPLFASLREETYARMQYPTMQVGAVEGSLLRMLVALTGARRVLEIGTFTGYSALMMAAGLPEDGALVTCEVDPKAAEVARRYFARSPHGRKIEIRMGPALRTLSSLPGPFDLAFLDADKEAYPAYLEALLPLLRRGGLLVADNTLWSGRVLSPEDDEDRAIHAFNERCASDARVEAVQLTVRDGVTLVRKR
jgi:caffeoyl-CoA O-methyltransferase